MFSFLRNRGWLSHLAWLCLALVAPALRADLASGLAAYRNGDYATALSQFRLAAESGDATAMFSLGFMYMRGEGVKTDLQEAVRWLSRSAERGVAPAQHSLALAYYEGRGVERNTAVAANYFESAALQGLADAQYNLAVLYSRGDGVAQDFALAKFWHQKAAENGLSDSMVALGVMHANGQGVPKDYPEAARWFGKAAAAGNKRAMRTLEIAFADSISQSSLGEPSDLRGSAESTVQSGVPEELPKQNAASLAARSASPPTASPSRRTRFWRIAPPALDDAAFQDLQARAVTGSPQGQLDLAMHYYHGNSVKRSLVRAYVWAKLAALKGNADAERMASAVLRELDAHQQSVANAVLNEWTKK